MNDSPSRRLEEKLALMRGALQPSVPAPPPRPISPVLPPLPADGRAGTTTTAQSVGGFVDWLAAEVCRRVGIAVNDSVRAKLAAVVAPIPPPALREWADRLLHKDASDPEWLSLVEMLTVHETYFMRDPNQIDFARRTAFAEVIESQRRVPAPRLRLWSAACSTGEEAYTLAILALLALADAGEASLEPDGTVRAPRRWSIDVLGTDLSRQAVRRAQEGVYQDHGMGAFRNLPTGLWRYFVALPRSEGPLVGVNSWRVRDDIRSLVRFRQFNLLSPQPAIEGVDLVFCRNVLIYFNAWGKNHAYRLICHALRPGGYAVFGPTDVPDDPNLFKAQWGPSTVIYRKA
ncbi:CheR family methyltransferase [Pararhodospirillum oryzae]|uniref:CheR-type methyltransferase domain-containing protein n=1 Tax=Pararhodospirillum oryzae TaxID=478448 RepID=A0A512H369_9PROT|nr:CheR family methyltransferase [Pararhodospirillum oryzae]GEO79904.1 hypothetical protein ROR02_00350 [Pararhodospirillum oryzae]